MPEVALTLNGRLYGGWEEVRISRGIEQMAGAFNLIASGRWPGGWDGQKIQRGDECAVSIDGETVITGFINRVAPRFDDQSHLIAIEGRDRAGDLVDCSAIYKGGQWRDASLTQIASDLAAPFGIPVIAATDVGDSFPSFAIQDGETVFEAIARAAALRGVLAISDKEGGIVLARAGQSRHAFGLQRPGNMLGGEADYSDDERFSDYIVKGQRRGTDDDEGAPEGPSSPVGQAQDSGVKRYRPLIIMAEDQVDGVDATRRAEWERNVRAGRSDRINVRVRGWREQGDKGDLWEPNRVVHINDTEWLWINADLLIADVNYLRGRMGTITEIGLMPALAFDLLQGQPTP